MEERSKSKLAGGMEEREETTNEYRVSFWDDKNIQELVVMVGTLIY